MCIVKVSHITQWLADCQSLYYPSYCKHDKIGKNNNLQLINVNTKNMEDKQ